MKHRLTPPLRHPRGPGSMPVPEGARNTPRARAGSARLTAVLVGAAALATAAAWLRGPAAATERAGLPRATAVPTGLDWEPRDYRGPTTVDAAIVRLGRELFFDERLSRSGAMSCATCHDPALAFTDGREVFVGDDGRAGHRNVPTIVNRGMGDRQFWDGRAADLAEQALGPLLAPEEMGLTRALFDERVAAEPADVERFREVFGEPPTLERAAMAIAAYEATVVSGASPFDRFEWLGESDALSAAARRGLRLFRDRAGCTTCHVGTNFTDERFHNLGVGLRFDDADGAPPAATFDDPGRVAVTGAPEDTGAFKTPTLRNVAETAPYMHDGSLATLAEVLAFYNDGGRANEFLDGEIKPLELDAQELLDLEAFLRSLTGPIVELDPQLFGVEPEGPR